MTALQHPAPATFTPALLDKLAHQHATPLWVYDADTIRARVARLAAFDSVRFAQKACSNTHVLRLLRALGVRVDAVSAGEIVRALHAGYDAADEHSGLVFTADVIDRPTLALVARHGIPVNTGSVAMVDQLGAALGDHAAGHRVWLRINPGFGHGHSHKVNTGGESSKHGIWPTDVPAALEAIARHGMRLVGLHMHIGSGVDYGHLAKVCDAMVQHVQDVVALGHDVTAISTGGGLSIPYREGEAPVDTAHYFGLWDDARRRLARELGHPVHSSRSSRAASWSPNRGRSSPRCARSRTWAATTSCCATPASTTSCGPRCTAATMRSACCRARTRTCGTISA